jgi:peptide/nickel transport system permease protein
VGIFRDLLRNKVFVVGFVLILSMFMMGVFADVLAPYPKHGLLGTPSQFILEPPSDEFRLGTTETGRDLLSRIIYGARTSLILTIVVVSITLGIGFSLGVTAGFFGGWVDDVIMRIADMKLAFPSILLAMLIVATIGPGFWSVVMALGLTWWPWHARLSRSQAFSIRQEMYVHAARAMGAGEFKILFRHVIPNALGPNLVQASADLGSVLLAASGLSFLGLGIQEPVADWGLTIAQGRNYFPTFWWVSTFPGVFLSLTVLGFALMGESIREYIDPRLRQLIKRVRLTR